MTARKFCSKVSIYIIPLCILASAVGCKVDTEVSYGDKIAQTHIPRVDAMPELPTPYKMKNWMATSRDLYAYLFDQDATGEYRPFIWMDTAGRNFNQMTFGLYTAIGDVRQGAHAHGGEGHEAICGLGSLFAGSLVGYDFAHYRGNNYVRMSRNYFNKENGWNIVMNFTNKAGHVGGGYGNDWWYDVYNNMLFFGIGDQYPEEKGYDTLMHVIANQYYKADSILGDNYSYSYFDFAEMAPKTNHIVPQEDAAAGFAWLLYSAYQRYGDEKYLAGAKHALEVLLSQKESRFYEVLMPFGAYIAARMNAEQGTDYDVLKILNWTFDGTATNREGWGVILGNWGGYDIHGIVGSTIHNGGYGFLMNGFDVAWALVPMVRYDPRFADAIGKWMLNVANASHLFYPYDIPDSLQAIPEHKSVTKNLIAYEGLIKESTFDQYKGITPFAQGDGPNWVEGNPPESMFSVYGSAHVGIFGSIIKTTDVDGILRLNCLATDLFRQDAYPTWLYYNPYGEEKTITFEVTSEGKVDLYDVISKRIIASEAEGSCVVNIPTQSSLLIVEIPSGSQIEKTDDRLEASGVVIDFL